MEWHVSSNPEREVWRRILEYTNEEFSLKSIEIRQGKATDTSAHNNHKKQCRQLRAAILQAREFFTAIGASTLYTSPNHLYYGAASLATATMLLNGRGDKSLDALRKDKANARHGLTFTLGSNAACDALTHGRVRVDARGFFANWYSTLPAQVVLHAEHVTQCDVHRTTRLDPVGGEPSQSIEELASKSSSLLDLMRFLPDLHLDFRRYGIGAPSSRYNIKQTSSKPDKTIRFEFRIHGADSKESLGAILDQLKFRGSDIERIQMTELDTGAIVQYQAPSSEAHCIMPDFRTTLDHDDVVYAEPLPRLEIADAYRAAYGLSMLCRYYPDVWTKCLESHCTAAKLIERFVAVYADKFPLLALSLLTNNHIIVSHHRPWWY